MRAPDGWHNACILNVSSRGMLLQAADPPLRGSYLEIRRGAQVILARVVWTKSHRFGVETQDALPIEAMITNCALPAVSPATGGERRRIARVRLPADEQSRQRGRFVEFGFIAAMATFGAVLVAGEAYALLAAPIEAVETALAGRQERG